MAELSSTKVYGDLEVTGSLKNTIIPVTGTLPIVSSGGTAPAISINPATTSSAGSMSAADKIKLDSAYTGTPAGTNLGQGTLTTTTIPLTSSTGTGTTLPSATTSLAGLLSSADKTKLDGINRVLDVDAAGLPSITLDTANYDVFNISNLTDGDYIQLGSIPIGKTVMVVLNSPGAISILYTETVLWPNGIAPTHGSGWEVLVFSRIAAGVVLGSATLAHA